MLKGHKSKRPNVSFSSRCYILSSHRKEASTIVRLTVPNKACQSIKYFGPLAPRVAQQNDSKQYGVSQCSLLVAWLLATFPSHFQCISLLTHCRKLIYTRTKEAETEV